MKLLIGLLIIIYFTSNLMGQITIIDKNHTLTSPAQKADQTIEKYDSLRWINVNDKLAKKYIGQKLFLPRPRKGRDSISLILNLPSNTYNSFCNKYFTIIGVSEKQKKSFLVQEDQSGDTLKIDANLVGFYNDNNDIIQESYFVSVGFFVKAKKLYEGKNFIWVSKYGNIKVGDFFGKYFESGESGSVWHCSSVGLHPDCGSNVIAVLENGDKKLSIKIQNLSKPAWNVINLGELGSAFNKNQNYNVLEGNSKLNNLLIVKRLFNLNDESDMYIEDDLIAYVRDLQKIKLEVDKATKQKNAHDQIENQLRQQALIKAENEKKRQWLQTCITKYGEEIGKTVANGKVAIGMTKSMCEDSWKTPSDVRTTINETSTIELWIFNNRSSLYFVNGILKQIRN